MSVPDANRTEARSRTDRGDAEKTERLALFLGVCGGRRAQGADQSTPASIFSSARLFSFRRTFKVQQQSARILLQTGF